MVVSTSLLGRHLLSQAVDCLRLSLTLAPAEMRDIVFLGLANIFAQLERWDDAIFVAREALALRPDDFLYHFTLANVLAAKVSR